MTSLAEAAQPGLTSRSTMRAARIEAPGETSFIRARIPEPARDEVLVRLAGSGVCASSVPVWEGREWFEYPRSDGEPGHEGWGWIEATGEGVEDLEPGTPVACLSTHAFAEYDLAPRSAVIALHPSMDGKPFPGEAFGCAVNVTRRARIQHGETVVVIGVGFLGAAVVRLASAGGARVIAISRRGFALDLASRLGAAETIIMDDHARVVGAVRELTGGDGSSCVIEAAGAQWPLDLAAQVTAESGKLVIAGYHQDGPRQVNMQMWNWRALRLINAHERDPHRAAEGVARAARAVVDGILDPQDFITHEYTLEQMGDALRATRDKPAGFLKAIVRS